MSKAFFSLMLLKTFILSVFLSLIIGSSAGAQESTYYQGKTLTIYVGRTPGSGADLAARVLAQFWSQ